MFLKSLEISNKFGNIRLIKFRAGLNLIVDETPDGAAKETGNNVGKTTVLMLIDFCLGANAKALYTDPENKKIEHTQVKTFLLETEALIKLTLTDILDGSTSTDIVIERNFLSRKHVVRKINGVQRTEDEFLEELTNCLIPGHYGKKPTFPQLISHNIRYKDLSLSNTLRTLNEFTRDDEYETLHLFMLGCTFDQGELKQNLLGQLRVEFLFKSRLESQQNRSAYEALLNLVLVEIENLEARKYSFNLNTSLESDLNYLAELKYKMSALGAELTRNKIRLQLVIEAEEDIRKGRANIDVAQLRSIYEDVSARFAPIGKSFSDLVDFHNQMIDEKIRYITKDLPALRTNIAKSEQDLKALVQSELSLVRKIEKSGSIEDLEALIVELNKKHRVRGEYEKVISQISSVDAAIEELKSNLSEIDETLFSTSFESAVQAQLNKLNRHFATVSDELYGEKYAVKFDRVKTKTGQQVYKFSAFNTNFSSGKKQGEITCFDIAYTLFADEEGIPCYHFLLSDKKELMHDNQLAKIGKLVERRRDTVQFVASILRDKLPFELNQDEYIALRLSQHDKLFRIESSENGELAN